MQDLNSQQSPFSGRILWVILLTFSLMFLWNKYLEKKYPQMHAKQTAPEASSTDAVNTTNSQVQNVASKVVNDSSSSGSSELEQKKSTVPVVAKIETLIPYESEDISFQISSKGMALKKVQLKKYKNHDGSQISLGQSDSIGLFELRVGLEQKPVEFEVKQTADGRIVGSAVLGETTITRELQIDKETSAIHSTVSILKPSQEILAGVKILLPEKTVAKQSSSMFFPSYEHQDFLVNQAGKVESVNFSSAKQDINKIYPTSSLVSIGSQYFSTALLDKSDILPETRINSNNSDKSALAEVIYKPTSLAESFKFTQVLFVGPKLMDNLNKIDPEMSQIIDFGMWGFIARPLVYVMKTSQKIVVNWGLAIILLTVLVRLLVLPFNIMSAKSMKAMQKIQPQMTALREKFKDDPVRMNQEVMSLMKENKANPLGGCLPMLLQIPVFFALYRVIGSSVELYQSPFFGWITDLSQHDKFYIFPVLMGITMFIQQKMTPSTMDPQQAKILAFMPLIFTVFMLQLPSGLTLYMFVSALFGITQQWFMLRQKNA